MQRSWLVGLLVLAACSKTAKPEPIPASPDGWRCFVIDPADTDPGHQGISHTRQRVIEGRLEVESVGFLGQGPGAIRMVYKPVGDHLEDARGRTGIKARLLAADGTHWTLAFRPEPGSGGMMVPFDEDTVIDDTGLTVTSMLSDGKTVVRYVPASCDVVVAELAKYP